MLLMSIVPIGLRLVGSDPDNVPRSTILGRDRDNNIMVYFSDMDKIARPWYRISARLETAAVCWLYLARAAAWSGAQPSS